MPPADDRQLTLLAPEPAARRRTRARAAPQLALLPDEGHARLLTPRDLARRFGRRPPAPRLLTPGDLLQRFGRPSARLLTARDFAQRFGQS